MFSSYYMSLAGHVSPNKMHPSDVAVVLISPEDREQVDALTKAIVEAMYAAGQHACAANGIHPDTIATALRSLIAPPKPDEPTEPTARIADRRENIWRLLADGDWVCTSGPDIGEYLEWSHLTERGPLSIEVPW